MDGPFEGFQDPAVQRKTWDNDDRFLCQIVEKYILEMIDEPLLEQIKAGICLNIRFFSHALGWLISVDPAN